jgi:glutamyl/glutaminyl-tRNA synthetase
VLSASHVFDAARRVGGEVLLRVEDHDRLRCRPEYEAALLDDLDWLGFAPDRYPTEAFRAGRCDSRQSDRRAVYEEAAAHLQKAGLVYACVCSRREVQRLASAAPGDEPRYPGTCRDRGIEIGAGVSWRLRLDDAVEHFVDGRCGPQAQTPAAVSGDLLIRDRLGHWSYQFAVSVDDFRQGVTDVIRGMDLLASTGRQIKVARLLGRANPAAFTHHGLVMRPGGQKLSKSSGDTAIRALRTQGWSPEAVIAAARAGEEPQPSPGTL